MSAGAPRRFTAVNHCDDGGEEGGRRWRDRAACRGSSDPELFFPAAQAGPVYVEQVARAKAVCAQCPARAACLEFALRALPDGVAGGTTPEERRALAGRGGHAGGGQRGVDEPDPATGWGASRREVCAAGRAALRAGGQVRAVAREFGVTERTAYRWAQQARNEQEEARVQQVRAG